MKLRKPKLPAISKKIWIPIVSVVLAAALVVGILAVTRNKSGGSVYVYDIGIVGMTDYWGDSQETSGRVQSDNIQTVMLSDTQEVTGIQVAEGDTVKKGDLLLSYDTTLTELGLEKKRLAVEQLKLELQEEEDRLVEIRNLQPYTPREDSGSSWTAPEGDSFTYDHYPDYSVRGEAGDAVVREWLKQYGGYDGSSAETPLICWTQKDHIVDDTLINEMADFLARCRYLTALDEYDAKLAQYQKELEAWQASEDPDKGEEPKAPEAPQEDSYFVKDFYMVVKSTYGNKTLKDDAAWQGMHAYVSSSGFFFVPFDASGVSDYTRPPEPEQPSDDDSTVDQGPFYTLAEIVQMKEDQQKKILDVKYKIKIAEAEYNIAQKEANDGNVYAEVDGKVISVITAEEAKQNKQPIIKVSGGGGYYITGTISELDRDKLEIGSEVTVTDYRNGTSCMGTVESIGDFPSSDGSNYYGNGNPNVSTYPFTVFVDESEDLVSGYYVNMQYTLSDAVDGIYLEKAFVRTENGASFVYVKGANGKLERRNVTTGKTVWGSYVQVLSGVTAEDAIAFPYGKNVKAGAATEAGDYSTLYGD